MRPSRGASGSKFIPRLDETSRSRVHVFNSFFLKKLKETIEAGGNASCEARGRELLGLSGVPEGALEAVSAEDAMAHTGRVLGFEYGAKGHKAAAVACLDPESQAQLALALAQNQPGEVERLRKQARTAFSDKGAAACLPPESQAQLAL